MCTRVCRSRWSAKPRWKLIQQVVGDRLVAVTELFKQARGGLSPSQPLQDRACGVGPRERSGEWLKIRSHGAVGTGEQVVDAVAGLAAQAAPGCLGEAGLAAPRAGVVALRLSRARATDLLARRVGADQRSDRAAGGAGCGVLADPGVARRAHITDRPAGQDPRDSSAAGTGAPRARPATRARRLALARRAALGRPDLHTPRADRRPSPIATEAQRWLLIGAPGLQRPDAPTGVTTMIGTAVAARADRAVRSAAGGHVVLPASAATFGNAPRSIAAATHPGALRVPSDDSVDPPARPASAVRGPIACPARLADRPLGIAGDDRTQPPATTTRFSVLTVHTGRTNAATIDRLGQTPRRSLAAAAHRQRRTRASIGQRPDELADDRNDV